MVKKILEDFSQVISYHFHVYMSAVCYDYVTEGLLAIKVNQTFDVYQKLV